MLDSAFNRSRYYHADGTLNVKAEAAKGVVSAPVTTSATTAANANESMADKLKSEFNKDVDLVKTDKAYTGLAVGISAGLAIAFYVNKKKHYGIAGYLGMALAGGFVGYGVGKSLKDGIASGATGGIGSKDSQIEGKVNGLVDKIVANADKLDLKDNKTGKKVTPAQIVEMKAMVKAKLPEVLSKFTDSEKVIILDGLDSVSKIADEVISSNKKIEPMQLFVWLDTIMKDLSAKHSEKELKDFTEKANRIADEAMGKK